MRVLCKSLFLRQILRVSCSVLENMLCWAQGIVQPNQPGLSSVRVPALTFNKYFDYLKWSHNKIQLFSKTDHPADHSAHCPAALYEDHSLRFSVWIIISFSLTLKNYSHSRPLQGHPWTWGAPAVDGWCRALSWHCESKRWSHCKTECFIFPVSHWREYKHQSPAYRYVIHFSESSSSLQADEEADVNKTRFWGGISRIMQRFGLGLDLGCTVGGSGCYCPCCFPEVFHAHGFLRCSDPCQKNKCLIK